MEKDSLFNKWCWKNWTDTCKRRKLENPLTPYTKINLNKIKDLNIKPYTIKFFKENIGHIFFKYNLQQYLCGVSPRAMEIK